MSDEAEREDLDILPNLAGFNLRRLHARFAQSWREHFQAFGLPITPVQGGVLLLIDRHKQTTQTALAALLSVEPASMQAVLRPLESGGFVLRRKADRDRRSMELVLSDRGREAVRLIRREVARQEREALAGLDAAEIEAFVRLLRRAVAGSEAPWDSASS